WLHRLVPPARGMASPERIGVLVTLATAALVGLGIPALQVRLPHAARMALTGVLAILLPLEHWSSSRRSVYVPTGSQVPSVYAALASDSGPVVELPLYPDPARKLWAAYPYFSTRHWRRMPIGRTSFYPPAHDLLAWGLRDFPAEPSLTLLDRLGVRAIVVHPQVWTLDERRVRLAALEAEPRLTLERSFDDVVPARYAAFGLGQERLYRLAAGPPAAPPCTPADAIDRSGWTMAGSGSDAPDRARDGDPRTAWRTDLPQRPGDRLEMHLAAPETVSAVALSFGYPFDEFPRNLVVMTFDASAERTVAEERGGASPRRGDAESGDWERVAYADGPEERWSTIDELLRHPREARLVLRIPKRRVRAVRLMVGLREQDLSWPRWRVGEVALYRDCR
ncbi:MAG TPA: hypothetical protein VFQ51_02465, partial [Vicinamibacteria bacterium]|nr:hypothetical protein [Vicinamibacteria bacterium]